MLYTVLSVPSIMCANFEELEPCCISHVTNNTKTHGLPLPMPMSISSISSKCNSIVRGNVSLKCSRISSCDIPMAYATYFSNEV